MFSSVAPKLLTALVCVTLGGALGCGSSSPCETDDDCAAGERCISAGGVLFAGSECIVTMATVSPDVARDVSDVPDAGPDARSDLPTDGGGKDVPTPFDADPDVPPNGDVADMGPTCDPVETCDPVVEVHVQEIGSCLRRESGVVACWGSNFRGRIGNAGAYRTPEVRPKLVVASDGGEPFRASAVCSTSTANCAIDTSGKLFCWGQAAYLGVGAGIGDGSRNAVPRPVVSTDPQFQTKTFDRIVCDYISVCAIDTEGGLWCWGDANDGATNPEEPDLHVASAVAVDVGAPVVDVSVGYGTACAVTDAQQLYCWGQNRAGNLGVSVGGEEAVGPTEVMIEGEVVDVATQYLTSCASTTDDELYCWGSVDGMIDDNITEISTPTLIPTAPAPIDDVGAGPNVACVRSESDVYCWGQVARALVGDSNHVPGGLGEPLREPTLVEGLPPVESLFMSEFGVCAIADGLPWCWGVNVWGQLGRDDIALYPDPVEVGMPAGTEVDELLATNSGICAVTSLNELFCWGQGPPGLETAPGNYAIGTPTQVPLMDVTWVGHTPWEPLAIADGGVHRLVRECCGDRIVEVPEPGSPDQIAETNTEMCWSRDGSDVSCNGEMRTSNSLDLVATELRAGVEFFCAKERDKRELWCWGEGTYGQLGTGGTPDRREDPAQVVGLGPVARFDAGWSHACAIRDPDDDGAGPVSCWGANHSGQAGAPPTTQESVVLPNDVQLPRPAVDVSSGWRYSCAVLDNQEVWCWGANDFRQSGGTENVQEPMRVAGISATRVFAASSSSTYAIDAQDPTRLWCWGTGASGVCGTDAEVYSATPAPIRDVGPLAPMP